MTRAPVLLMLALVARAAAQEDDPKLGRMARAARKEPRAEGGLPDEDDPKLARRRRARWPRIDHPVPRFKLSYRYMTLAGLDPGTTVAFHAPALEYYPLSNLFRLGLATEVGLSGDSYGTFYVGESASLGIQWPARVTPFVDGRFLAAIIGATVMGHSGVSYLYGGGLDTGVEVYFVKRYYFSAAIGWMHPTYAGGDLAALKRDPTRIVLRDFTNDTFTLKIGLGL
jgi:hypothetical protein